MLKATVQASSCVDQPSSTTSDAAPLPSPTSTETTPAATDKLREIGGREGPDPTRFGDWELRGRCIDF